MGPHIPLCRSRSTERRSALRVLVADEASGLETLRVVSVAPRRAAPPLLSEIRPACVTTWANRLHELSQVGNGYTPVLWPSRHLAGAGRELLPRAASVRLRDPDAVSDPPGRSRSRRRPHRSGCASPGRAPWMYLTHVRAASGTTGAGPPLPLTPRPIPAASDQTYLFASADGCLDSSILPTLPIAGADLEHLTLGWGATVRVLDLVHSTPVLALRAFPQSAAGSAPGSCTSPGSSRGSSITGFHLVKWRSTLSGARAEVAATSRSRTATGAVAGEPEARSGSRCTI